LRPEAQRLTIKPERLVERINDLFTQQLCEQTIADYLLLIRDTLVLVPSLYDVTRALANVRASLRTQGFGE